MSELLSNYGHPWTAVGLAAAVGMVIALVAHAVLYAAFRRLGRYSVFAGTLAEYTHEPARAALPLFALQVVLAIAPAGLPYEPQVARAATIIFIAALTWLVVRAVAAAMEAMIRLHPATVSDNLGARRIQTQVRVLGRTAMFFIVLIGAASALMLFPGVRQIGTTLLASAGLAALAAGIAARPVLGNLIAGLQIALTQPIRLDDVVIIENEWGRIEEITATYVVVKIWDERRLVVPLQWVIENPFQNWTRSQSALLGTVLLWVDYRTPLAPLRAELERLCKADPDWDQRVALIQVVEASESAMQLRALVSAADAPKAWDLRCRVREGLIDFMQRHHADALPRVRAELGNAPERAPAAPPADLAGKGDSSAIRQPTQPETRAAANARSPAVEQDTTTGKGG